MEIVWKGHKVKKQVEKMAQSNLIVINRLKQLENAPCFLDIPASAKAHFLKGDLKGRFAVDFDYPARLVCEPVVFKKKGGQFIKETITAVEIIEIKKDYH
ncbi:hypothetical protein KKG48_03030 [Patescibacteria group bacterium]|nr:hypothetical protein [Patescibacteria group bacterium]MCG2695214.1 hypothetical protein [Candidatus Parcubacteria bacterium]